MSTFALLCFSFSLSFRARQSLDFFALIDDVIQFIGPRRRPTPDARAGTPTTLRQALSQLVPLLFPPLPSLSTSSSSSSSPAAPPPPPPLAYPLIHGIYPPFETEVGWLGACMAGPDGWVNVVVVLDERGQSNVSQSSSS